MSSCVTNIKEFQGDVKRRRLKSPLPRKTLIQFLLNRNTMSCRFGRPFHYSARRVPADSRQYYLLKTSQPSQIRQSEDKHAPKLHKPVFGRFLRLPIRACRTAISCYDRSITVSQKNVQPIRRQTGRTGGWANSRFKMVPRPFRGLFKEYSRISIKNLPPVM